MSVTAATGNREASIERYRRIKQDTARLRERVNAWPNQWASKPDFSDQQSIATAFHSIFALAGDLRKHTTEIYEEAKLLEDKIGQFGVPSRFLAFVEHDLAHLLNAFLAPFQQAAKEFSTSQGLSKQTIDLMQFAFNRAPSYLPFCVYPFDLFENIVAQHLSQPVEKQDIDLQKIIENCWLALAMRGGKKVDWKFEEYTPAQAANSAFSGILYQIEPGLQIKSVESYLCSIFYNLLKNAFKAMGMAREVQSDPADGFKMVVSARRHPGMPNIVIAEVIDNGSGFDLTTLLQNAPSFFAKKEWGKIAGNILTETEINTLSSFQGSPYASHLQITTLLNMLFLYRLSGFKQSRENNSGLGLWGMAQLSAQLHAQHLVGMNKPGIPPFDQGARFMLLLPENPDGWMPNTAIMTRNAIQGSFQTPWFQGRLTPLPAPTPPLP